MKAPMWIFEAPKTIFCRFGLPVSHILTAINNFDETFQSEKTWETLGKPEITLAEWADKLSV